MKVKKAVLLIVILAAVVLMPGYSDTVNLAGKLSRTMTLVIDPGHGGPDSGAVAEDGTPEKQINLQIAMYLKEEAEKYGVKVVMTRDSDTGLYYEGNNGGKWSKVGDMKERKRIIDEADPELTVSIHLNSFKQDSSVRGAQVFYPKNKSEQLYEENKITAEEIQESLKTGINDGTDRVTLPKSNIYLFEKVETKIILVECGFLSNNVDKDSLKTTEFQQKIAGCIMDAIAKHYSLELQKKEVKSVVESRT